MTCPEDQVPATATTCPEDQVPATATTCPEDQVPATATTCPKDQVPATATTCPKDQVPATATTCPKDQVPAHALATVTSPLGSLASLPASSLPAEPAAALRFGAVTVTLHPVLRTAMLVAWAALSGACREQGADPVRTAQAFTAAVQRGDMKAVLPLLEKTAADRLAAAADKASDQVGGRRRIEPAEMLQIVDISPTFELAQTQLIDNDGATAHVRLLGAQQEGHNLTLVYEDGAWHVRIPTPP